MKEKLLVRLNVEALEDEMQRNNIASDTELAAKLGVSLTQIWRAKLPPEDPRHNYPGAAFIAKVLDAFGGPFEKFFFLEKALRGRNSNNNL
ncbi:hypothetical protein ACVNS2_16455 [Paenibacillus caseinilyticus]|uniref:HTH cro/C1-type domain-containing protein n=1 Tax=Paenibacillus mucilaginosus K02 TaxID=997761 RepID=I0BIN8_9BACL|nr:hypothetical protein [Paenibacillus mucilaginosus]AFH62235.1 hypothetical protein B2K_16155 [Paenibacillus mucilaginosus K02]